MRLLSVWIGMIALLVAAVSLGLDSSTQTKRQDALGRVIYGTPTDSPTDLDLDLIPQSTEDLLREIERIPQTWTASKDVPYADLIRKASLRYGIDAGLIEAVMATESAFNPYAVSRSGAIGLMQLMPQTAKRFQVKDIFDPEDNVMGGARFLSYLLSLFNGDIERVAAGYNAGENAVLRYGGIPPYRETKNYVRKVRRYLRRLESNAVLVVEDPEDRVVIPSMKKERSPSYLLKPSPSQAPIYHYVDDRGVVHFTNVKPSQRKEKVHVWRPGR